MGTEIPQEFWKFTIGKLYVHLKWQNRLKDCAEFGGYGLTSNPTLFNNSMLALMRWIPQGMSSEKNVLFTGIWLQNTFSNFSHYLSLSFSLYAHTQRFSPKSFPSLHLAISHPSSSCWWSCCRQSAHSPQWEDSTRSSTTSLCLSHFLTVCLKLDIPQAHLSGAFEHSIQEKEDQSALRYEVCLNKPTRRGFFLLTLKTSKILDVHNESKEEETKRGVQLAQVFHHPCPVEKR